MGANTVFNLVMSVDKQQERLIETIFTASRTHSKTCVIRMKISENYSGPPIGDHVEAEVCICSKDNIMQLIDGYYDTRMSAHMAYANRKANDYAELLKRSGVERCVGCDDFVLESEAVYCDNCDAQMHEKCAGYIQSAGYYGDDGYAVCPPCVRKRDQQIEEEVPYLPNEYDDVAF